MSFTKQSLWVKDRLGGWRESGYQQFSFGHLKLMMPEMSK